MSLLLVWQCLNLKIVFQVCVSIGSWKCTSIKRIRYWGRIVVGLEIPKSQGAESSNDFELDADGSCKPYGKKNL